MKVVIVKYNAGNIQSVSFALQRIGISPIISNNIEIIQSADKIIFPGVGEASSAMQYLKKHHLDTVLVNCKQPLLGICLGMQLLCAYSEEGNTHCLNIFKKTCLKKFANINNCKVPQIGWNKLQFQNHELFNGLKTDSYIYNVHSYYVPLNEFTIATCKYEMTYSAALQKNNFYGVQFHPEKSGTIGEQILKNFIQK